MIAKWEPYKDLMIFNNLDSLQDIIVLSIAWRFTDNAMDAWTQRLNRFKDRDARAVGGAIRTLSYSLNRIFSGKQFGLMSAIPSQESVLPENAPLFTLGHSIARECEWKWLPSVLTKRPHASLHHTPGATARDNIVRNAYTARTVTGVKTVCILDDFVTRGSTIAEIRRALLLSNPNLKLFALVLGKTERQGYAASCNVQINNNHVPVRLAQLWDETRLN